MDKLTLKLDGKAVEVINSISVSEEAADRIYAELEEPPNINKDLREVADKMQANGGFYYGYSDTHHKHNK